MHDLQTIQRLNAEAVAKFEANAKHEAEKTTTPVAPEEARAEEADRLVALFQAEEERNRARRGTYENVARDDVRDAVLFALDHGWSADA